MTDHDLINILIAIALGALVGLEREFKQMHKDKNVRGFGGIRTFPLIALLGALSGFFSDKYSIMFAVIGFAATAILIIISHYIFASKEGRIGLTTEVAGLITFLIGVLAYLDLTILAVSLTVIMTFLLYERNPLHHFAKQLREGELYSTIKFAIIAFVILPILPNRVFGPYGIFNPYQIWTMVVLVSGISFVGYILVKVVGTRMRQIMSFLTGFVSSTATTMALINERQDWPQFIYNVIMANTAMIMKVLVIVFLVKRELFGHVVWSLGVMITMSIVIAIAIRLLYGYKGNDVTLGSPFTLKPALKFAAAFLIILSLVRLGTIYLGQKGTYTLSFISGLADADSTVLSALQITAPNFAAIVSTSVVLVVVANTLSKGMLAAILGKKENALKLTAALVIIALSGLAWSGLL